MQKWLLIPMIGIRKLLSLSQKIVVLIFLTDVTSQNFYGIFSSVHFQLINALFEWCPIITIWFKKALPPLLNLVRRVNAAALYSSRWISVSCHGTQQALTFFISNLSWRIMWKELCETNHRASSVGECAWYSQFCHSLSLKNGCLIVYHACSFFPLQTSWSAGERFKTTFHYLHHMPHITFCEFHICLHLWHARI